MSSDTPGPGKARSALAVGCCVFVALLPIAVFAADPAPASAKAPRAPKPKPMTRDQLRTCMNLEDKVKAMRQDLLKQQTALDAQRTDVNRLDAELERQRAALDPADLAAVQAVNEAEVKRNVVSDEFNSKLRAARDLNSSYTADRQRWVEQCADKDYDVNDEAAIKRERQRAAKAASPTK